jgi:ABC-type sulfate/molybdate transport systems ATPase subunit
VTSARILAPHSSPHSSPHYAPSLDVDLSLPAGITALAGPPGAGKTRLLEIIAGFQSPASGRILVEDAIVFDAPSRVKLPPRLRHCAFIAAHDALFPHMTVRQNLMFAAHRWARLERHKRVADMLERFELTAALEVLPRELLPAHRLRIEIARALLAETKLLLIDERTTPDETLLRIIRDIFPGSVLIVTNDLELCYSAADRLALLASGRILQYGPARQVIEHPDSLAAARLTGIANLFPATIAALDPGRNQSRLACEHFTLYSPYLKGRLNGDSVHIGIRAEDVRVHAGEIEPDSNYAPVRLLRAIEGTRTVRMEFSGGITAVVSQEQFRGQKDNRGWQVELPAAALRVF